MSSFWLMSRRVFITMRVDFGFSEAMGLSVRIIFVCCISVRVIVIRCCWSSERVETR